MACWHAYVQMLESLKMHDSASIYECLSSDNDGWAFGNSTTIGRWTYVAYSMYRYFKKFKVSASSMFIDDSLKRFFDTTTWFLLSSIDANTMSLSFDEGIQNLNTVVDVMRVIRFSKQQELFDLALDDIKKEVKRYTECLQGIVEGKFVERSTIEDMEMFFFELYHLGCAKRYNLSWFFL